MSSIKKFAGFLTDRFSDDRLTWQKGIATFHPESVTEVAELFKMAIEHDRKLYISGFGNNINPSGDSFRDILTIQSDRMNQLTKIVGQDLYIEVGCGYPLRELNKNLEEHGLFLPHSDLPYVGSVGGALAVSLSMVRDNDPNPVPLGRFFIKADIATPDGDIINPGSACFKSVSGLDIVKIFSPSWGLLGMITSAILRVLPISARDEYKNMAQQAIDYKKFSDIYKNPGDNQSALYSIKIKNKFDPNNILPLIQY